MKTLCWTAGFATCLVAMTSTPASGQVKWYKFDKKFIEKHYQQDGSAIGSLKASAVHPAKNVHAIDCGGNDGEVHIGISEDDLGNGTIPISAFAQENDSQFGIVAEPPNVKRGSPFFTKIEATEGNPSTFFGYFRLWNEGHDVTAVFPSNPHHVLEVHPVWGIRSTGFIYNPRPAVIFSMPGYSGYGASKFVPMLQSLPGWFRVAEDNRFVYVRLQRADNFYQLPVKVKQVRTIANGVGVAALVDVFSDGAHQNLMYQDLTVVTAANDPLSTRLTQNSSTFLLGFFSVNLKKAEAIASGHGRSDAVAAPGALEFFAFGVPLQKAVSKSTPCTPEGD
jgi:hypothetical protein